MGFLKESTGNGNELKTIEQSGVFEVVLKKIKGARLKKSYQGKSWEADGFRFCFSQGEGEATRWAFYEVTATKSERGALFKFLSNTVSLKTLGNCLEVLEQQETSEGVVSCLQSLVGKKFNVKMESAVSKTNGKTYYNIKAVEPLEKIDFSSAISSGGVTPQVPSPDTQLTPEQKRLEDDIPF